MRKLISSVRTARAKCGNGGRGPPGLFPLLQAPKTHPRRLLGEPRGLAGAAVVELDYFA